MERACDGCNDNSSACVNDDNSALSIKWSVASGYISLNPGMPYTWGLGIDCD